MIFVAHRVFGVPVAAGAAFGHAGLFGELNLTRSSLEADSSWTPTLQRAEGIHCRIQTNLRFTARNCCRRFCEATIARTIACGKPRPDDRYEVTGEVSGIWDINRLNQLLGDLVVNALKYGAYSSPVKVALKGSPGEVVITVCNEGPTIEQAALARIFEPLKRGLDQHYVSAADGSMGLGLYIAREITTAHGGDIAASSDEKQTVFTVRLPRLSGKEL